MNERVWSQPLRKDFPDYRTILAMVSASEEKRTRFKDILIYQSVFLRCLFFLDFLKIPKKIAVNQGLFHQIWG